MKTLRMLSLLSALTVTTAISGCWSDDDEEAPPPTGTVAVPVPDSAGVCELPDWLDGGRRNLGTLQHPRQLWCAGG
jgi:hypothetical protein